MSYFWNQGDHIGVDGLMFATCGIAKADNLNRFFFLENNVLTAIAHHFNPLCPHHQGGGLRAASGKKNQGDKAFHYRSLAAQG